MGESPHKQKPSDISETILQQFRLFSKTKEEALIDSGKGEETKKRKSDDNRHIGLTEAEVGISEYVSELPGFTGIIKHRFSDFHVNEIDKAGNVVELTTIELPVEEEEPTEAERHKEALSIDSWSALAKIMNGEDGSEEFLEIDVSEVDKAGRSAMHKAVKFVYGPKVCSNTVERDGKKILKIARASKKNKDRNCWPEGRGQFLHCALFKENKDTTEVINALAKYLRIKPNFITYAGTKDKRAKTTQQLCIKQRPGDVVREFKMAQVALGNFCYKSNSLRLGDLLGNRFKIALRDLKAEECEIKKALDSLIEKGFINYFGMQRFGVSVIVPTFLMGKTLLRGDWKEAVELTLKPRPGEKCFHDVKEAREIWWKTRSAAKAIKSLTKFDRSLEGKLLQALKAQGDKAYFNAICAIPRNTLLLYLHSYQSLLWNKVVSRRIKEFGLKPLAGDLVLDMCTTHAMSDHDGFDQETDEKPVESQEVNLARPSTRHLSEEEAKEVSIYDVVYPLPGTDVNYPNNLTSQWYKDLLTADNLTEEHLKSSYKTFSLSGAYRHMIARPDNLKWQIVNYMDPDTELILSDLDKLQNKTLPQSSEHFKERALVVELTLKPSTYATMALREIMKCETSSSHHAALTSVVSASKKQKLD